VHNTPSHPSTTGPAPASSPARSPRVRLLAYAPSHLLTLLEAPEQFAERFGHPLADGLRALYTSGEVSPAWLARLRADAGGAPDPWAYGFAVVHQERGEVIGSGGFKGPPDADGVVEIAYGIAPGDQGQGYATETARALVAFALADARVRLVRAHTEPRRGASPRVLEKCGFAFAGEVDDPDDGPVWRWERPAAGRAA
jgi:RimJ/RimL family protein N-acetyltransferase